MSTVLNNYLYSYGWRTKAFPIISFLHPMSKYENHDIQLLVKI